LRPIDEPISEAPGHLQAQGPRVEQGRALLARHGVVARVDAAGARGEILVVEAGPEVRPVLARLAPEVRSLGFRYLALDMNGEGQ
jgi:hypothetical protein